MQYLRSSPLYNIPIPQVYDWDLSFNNPVGAPYILREVVIGKNLAEDDSFYRLSAQDQIKVIKALAVIQAELSKPSEFDKIGSLYHHNEGEGGGGGGGGGKVTLYELAEMYHDRFVPTHLGCLPRTV